MSTATQLLARKHTTVWSVRPQSSVYDAIALMAEKEIGALLVANGESLLGILSERDYARKVILKGKESRHTLVEEIMTCDLITAAPDDTLDNCMETMSTHHIRHLPIIDQGKVAGILSLGDLVKAKIAEQQATIDQLETYIMT